MLFAPERPNGFDEFPPDAAAASGDVEIGLIFGGW
jgi:hypothetical protein